MTNQTPGETVVESLHRSRSGPVRVERNPFVYRQFPVRRWRIMGRWENGDEFLIRLARNPHEAIEDFPRAMREYTEADMTRIEFVWLERWSPGSRFRSPHWVPKRELNLRLIRFSRAIDARRERTKDLIA